MEVIEKYGDQVVDLKDHLKRLGDIINIDGPVLSLFQDERNKDLYLFDWVDSDETTNRWLIYKIPPETLNEFLLNRISYKEMFDSVKENKFYYADITNSDSIEYSINDLEYFPQNYIPAKEAFFDKNDSKNLNKILDTINSILINKGKENTDFNYIHFYKEENFFFLLTQERFEDYKNPREELKNNFIKLHVISQILETQPDVTESNRIPEEAELGLFSR